MNTYPPSNNRWRGPWQVGGSAPRALEDNVRPRRLSGVVVRPLNFTVRVRERTEDLKGRKIERIVFRMKSRTEQRIGRLPSFEDTACARDQFPCSCVTPAHVAAILSLPCRGFEVVARRVALCSSVWAQESARAQQLR